MCEQRRGLHARRVARRRRVADRAPGRMTHASVAGTDLEVPGRPGPPQRRHRDRRRPARRPRPRPVRRLRRAARSSPAEDLAVCVDFGSTFTKAALVDLGRGPDRGRRRATTTAGADDGDVLDGYDACLAALVAGRPAGGRRRGAGLLQRRRRAADRRRRQRGAGHRRGGPPGRAVQRRQGGRRSSPPPVGADDEPRRAWRARARRRAADRRHRRRQRRGAARRRTRARGGRLARARSWSPATWTRRPRWRGPRPRLPHVLADNVVPRIGVLAPESARAAIREMFLAHVIGGKHLSAAGRLHRDGARRDPRRRAHRGRAARPRPRRAHPGAGDVVVVDVGGATTDVHSVVELDPDTAHRGRPGPRGGRHHAGHPHRRGRPRHALVGVHHRRAGRAEGPDDLADAAAAGAAPTRASCPAPTPSATSDEAHRAGRGRAGPAPPRRPGPGRAQPRGTGRRAHRQGPARGRPAGRVGRRAAPRPARRRERVLAGSTGADVEGGWQLPRRRGSSSTATTCWRPPACSPAGAPRGGVPAGAAPARADAGWSSLTR